MDNKDTDNKLDNQFIRHLALKMLINVTSRICGTVTSAEDNHALTPIHIRELKGHLKLMEKALDVAEATEEEDALHCILVSLGRKKRTPEPDQESNQEKTDQEPQQSEPDPNQEEPIQDEPVPEELVQEEQKETQQQ